jgi:hypothetical protein
MMRALVVGALATASAALSIGATSNTANAIVAAGGTGN